MNEGWLALSNDLAIKGIITAGAGWESASPFRVSSPFLCRNSNVRTLLNSSIDGHKTKCNHHVRIQIKESTNKFFATNVKPL